MPDQTPPTTTPVLVSSPAAPTTTAVLLTDAQKEALTKAKTPLWKTILWWVLGTVLALLALIGVLALIKWKTPVQAAKDTVTATKESIRQSDMDAKIAMAKAQQMQDAAIKKLEEIKAMPDEQKALEELNKLLKVREAKTHEDQK